MMDWLSNGGAKVAGSPSPKPGDTLRSGVMEPGAGEISTRGPVHLERRATTSARSDRSVNAAFGWFLICRHAASQGMVSDVLNASDMRRDDVSCAAVGAIIELDAAGEPETDSPKSGFARPHVAGLPQQPPPLPPADEQAPPPFE